MKKSIIFTGIGLILSASAFYYFFYAKEAPVLNQTDARGLLMQIHERAKGELADKNKISKYFGGTITQNTQDSQDLQVQRNPNIPIIIKQCLADETQFLKIETSLIKNWANSWIEKDTASFAKLLVENPSANEFKTSGNFKKIDTIKFKKWETINQIQGKESIKTNVAEYLSEFNQVDDLDIIVKKFITPANKRAPDSSMKSFNAEIRYDLRGKTTSGLREDRGYLNVFFERQSETSNDWKIANIEIIDMETLENDKPSFKDITHTVGLNDVKSYPRLEAIRRGGYSIAVNDYNNDGVSDMYVGAYGPGTLLKGSKDGRFQIEKNSGLGETTFVKTASWADFDNDGNQDLMLVRFVQSSFEENFNSQNKEIIIYKNQGNGTFANVGQVYDTRIADEAMPAALADFNNDGLLDFYIGYPGHKDFTTFTSDFKSKKNLKAQGVYINEGNFVFKPQAMSTDPKNDFESFSEAQKVYPHSSIAVDFDQDGNVDILVIDDRGNLSPLYKNTGNGNFIQANELFKIENQDIGMGIATTDINNDGYSDILMTNVRFNSKSRISDSCRANWDYDIGGIDNRRDIKAFLGTQGKNGKTFYEASNKIGLKELGDGLGGIEFIDYNNDGFDDLYVTNGLWSGTSKYDDVASLFVRTYSDFENVLHDEREKDTQSLIMNVLSNYKGDLYGNPTPAERLSFGGFQRNRLFRNNKDGTFTEVGYLEGVDSIADGYIVAKADINGDGKLDLLLRNADPGTKDINFPPIQVFQNANSINNNAIRVKLVGGKSNINAIGAEVEVKLDNNTKLFRQVVANNGAAQSESLLHFGIGSLDKAESIRVKWPSGKLTYLNNIKKGTIEIHEDKGSQKISFIK